MLFLIQSGKRYFAIAFPRAILLSAIAGGTEGQSGVKGEEGDRGLIEAAEAIAYSYQVRSHEVFRCLRGEGDCFGSGEGSDRGFGVGAIAKRRTICLKTNWLAQTQQNWRPQQTILPPTCDDSP